MVFFANLSIKSEITIRIVSSHEHFGPFVLDHLTHSDLSLIVKFILVNISAKQINYLLTTNFVFKFFARVFSLSDHILLQEWSHFILDLMIRSDLFVSFLIQNDLFQVFLRFFYRNLQSDIAREQIYSADHHSSSDPHASSSGSSLNRSTGDLFYRRLFGSFPGDSPFQVDQNLFQKLCLELISSQGSASDKRTKSDSKPSKDVVLREAVDRDGLPVTVWDLLALRKFEDVFVRNSENWQKSKGGVTRFGVVYAGLSLVIKFVSFAFLRNRNRAFFKNYVSNELLTQAFVDILEGLAERVLQFSLDLGFFENFFGVPEKFDYLEKMNFLLKFSYSASDNFHGANNKLLKTLKHVHDQFFRRLSKQVKPSSPGSMNSSAILLKVYEEAQFPFGDCLKMVVKHSDPYSLIEQKISQEFDTIPFFSVLHVNFDDVSTNISESEKNFRNIVSNLDALHTFYDGHLEVKLIVKEEVVHVVAVQCSTCPAKFEVENTLENREGQLLCTSCQNRFVNLTNSKKNFFAFRNN